MIEKFINERIIVAVKAIAELGIQKIRDGEVILTYGRYASNSSDSS